MYPIIAACSLLLCSGSFLRPVGPALIAPEGAPPAGFSEAYLDAATVQGMLGHKDCTGLRLYNVKRSKEDQAGTVLAIGIASDGSEQYAWLGPKYQMFERIEGGSVVLDGMSSASATDACGLMRSAGVTSFAADFQAGDVLRLLASEGCNGLKVVAAGLADGSPTMRVMPAIIHDGRADEVAGGEQLLCSQPCPAFCGRPENYVNTVR